MESHPNVRILPSGKLTKLAGRSTSTKGNSFKRSSFHSAMLRLKCIFRFLDAHPKGYYFLQMLVGVVILQHVVCTCLRFWFLECKDQVPSLRKSVTSLFTYRFQASIFSKGSRIWKATLSHLLYQQTFLLCLVAKSLSGKCAQPHIAKYSFAWTFSQYNGEPATFSLIEN